MGKGKSEDSKWLVLAFFGVAKAGAELSIPYELFKDIDFQNKVSKLHKKLRNKGVWAFAEKDFRNNRVIYSFRKPTAKEKKSSKFSG